MGGGTAANVDQDPGGLGRSFLLALTLLTFVVGWVRHLPWWARLSAVVPLAASIGIASAIPGLHTTYVFWATICNFCCGHG